MVNRKQNLSCECKGIPIISKDIKKAVLATECKCKSDSRKGREFDQVTVILED